MEVKVPRRRSSSFLIKLRLSRLRASRYVRFGYAAQRRKKSANRRAEIGLNARSQPIGILSRNVWDADGATAFSAEGSSGSRSPFRVRSTDGGGVITRKPALGKDAKVTKLAISRPECTATIRANEPRPNKPCPNNKMCPKEKRPMGAAPILVSPFSPTHRHRCRRNRTKLPASSSKGVLFSPACGVEAGCARTGPAHDRVRFQI